MDPNHEADRISVQITVLRGKYPTGNKTILSFVHVEFNGTEIGDSQKLDTGVDESVNYNLICSFDCSKEFNTLDDLANKPVILTLFEITAKGKHKENNALGQAVVDLLPLLQGQSSFSCTVVLHPILGSHSEIFSQDGENKPTLDVEVSVPVPLLSDIQLSESNLLSVTVETAYSVPEVWSSATGPKYNYMAALQVPLTAERDQRLLFSSGVLKMGSDREQVPRAKKWPNGQIQAPDAKFMSGTTIEEEPTDFEYGDLTSTEDRNFRAKAEQICQRVSWDAEHRCLINAGRVACLTSKIVNSRLWPVEVVRYLQTAAGKGKSKDKSHQDDELQISFHGVAYIDLVPLLYPGVKSIRGAYSLHPFYEQELMLKTNRNKSILRESTKMISQTGAHHSSSGSTSRPVPSKVTDAKGGDDSKDPHKKCMMDSDLQVNPEGQMYADSRSYIVIDIALEKPIIPKRPAEEVAKRVRELIPPRTPLPRRPAGAERAVQEYQAQIMNVTGQILQQYEQMFGAAFVPGAKPLDSTKQEQRKSQLLGELNYSGMYFTLKENIKHSVLQIVQEKMLTTGAFTDPAKLQGFLSQLFVFLTDEMHVAFNKTLSMDTKEVKPQLMPDCNQLRHFAKEAQLNEDYQLAAHYYQEQLTRDQSNPSHWFDYGVFCMLTTEYLKAEECFHKAVSVNQEHIPSLLMCGILSELNNHCEDSEIFFERAISIEPCSIVSWTILGLFYLAQDMVFQADIAFHKANRVLHETLRRGSPKNNGQVKAEKCECTNDYLDSPALDEVQETKDEAKSQSAQVTGADDADKTNISPESNNLQSSRDSTSIYLETVTFLLQNYALQMAQRALAQELLCSDGGPNSSYHLALAHLYLLRGENCNAMASLQKALTDDVKNNEVWALYGHVHFMMKNYDEAQKFYEGTLDFVTDASDIHLVYLRLGSIYLHEGQYGKAKSTYIRACKRFSSCLTWLGLGIACYRFHSLPALSSQGSPVMQADLQGPHGTTVSEVAANKAVNTDSVQLEELTEAEEALTEANTLNNNNPEVWGYLSLVCLRTGRKVEAEQSFKYAIKLNLREDALLLEIKELQAQMGFGNPYL